MATNSEARLKSIVQTAVDGIVTIDERGMVDTFNAARSDCLAIGPKRSSAKTCQDADARALSRPTRRVPGSIPGHARKEDHRCRHPCFTTKAKGTGLGMAIAKRIVEAHGGQIAANGNATVGAEFQITLPRQTV